MRCSQPLTGTSGKRCKDDEKLVNAVLGIGRRGYIVDTRSQSVAKAEQKLGILLLIKFYGWLDLNIYICLQYYII